MTVKKQNLFFWIMLGPFILLFMAFAYELWGDISDPKIELSESEWACSQWLTEPVNNPSRGKARHEEVCLAYERK